MGSKVGRFKTIKGNEITVSFYGDNVSDGSVVLGANPVSLSMSGKGGAYEPVKYVTGSVSLVVDEALTEMFTSRADVFVRIDNETTEKTLFLGIVSPNTYSQDVGDIASELSVEVVDMLGAAKLIDYPLMGKGFGVAPLYLVVDHIVHQFPDMRGCYWPDTIRVAGAASEAYNSTAKYYMMTVAESAFFDDINPYSPHISEGAHEPTRWPSKAPSMYDVLEMIAQSLLLTLVQDGDAFVFVDYLSLRDTGATYTHVHGDGDIDDGIYYSNGYRVTPGKMISSDVRLSSIEKYEKFEISNTYTEQERLTPSFSDEGLLSPIGDMHTEWEDGKVTQWQELEHLCFETAAGVPDGNYYRGSNFVAWLTQDDAITNATTDVYPQALFCGSWEKALACYIAPTAPATEQVLLRKKAAFPVSVNGKQGIGLYIKLTIAAANGYHDYPPNELYAMQGERDYIFDTLRVRVRVGDYYYSAIPTTSANGTKYYWIKIATYTKIGFEANGQFTSNWLWCRTSLDETLVSKPTPVAVRDTYEDGEIISGDLEVELIAGKSPSGGMTLFIKEFEVGTTPAFFDYRAITNNYKTANLTYYAHDGGVGEYEAVELPLTLLWGHSKGYLGTFIEGVDYSSREGGEIAGYPIYKHKSVLRYYTDAYDAATYYGESLVRLARLVNMGGNYTEEMTVADEAVGAATAIGYNGSKAVIAYERDIYNEEITITIL